MQPTYPSIPTGPTQPLPAVLAPDSTSYVYSMFGHIYLPSSHAQMRQLHV